MLKKKKKKKERKEGKEGRKEKLCHDYIVCKCHTGSHKIQ